MKLLKISRRAKRQFAEIANYSYSLWGASRSAVYLDAIDRTIYMLREHPLLGSERSEVKRAYRAFPAEQHVIFYRILGDTLEVAGILHVSMDPMRHF